MIRIGLFLVTLGLSASAISARADDCRTISTTLHMRQVALSDGRLVGQTSVWFCENGIQQVGYDLIVEGAQEPVLSARTNVVPVGVPADVWDVLVRKTAGGINTNQAAYLLGPVLSGIESFEAGEIERAQLERTYIRFIKHAAVE